MGKSNSVPEATDQNFKDVPFDALCSAHAELFNHARNLDAALREKDSQLHDVCEKLADSDVDYLEAQVKVLQDADSKQTAELAQARAEIERLKEVNKAAVLCIAENARERIHQVEAERDSLRDQLEAMSKPVSESPIEFARRMMDEDAARAKKAETNGSAA